MSSHARRDMYLLGASALGADWCNLMANSRLQAAKLRAEQVVREPHALVCPRAHLQLYRLEKVPRLDRDSAVKPVVRLRRSHAGHAAVRLLSEAAGGAPGADPERRQPLDPQAGLVQGERGSG